MIITNNEEALRKPCEEVKPEEAADLILFLETELNKANRLGAGGIGLSAIQCGITKKASIIRLGQSSEMSLNLINATIIEAHDPIVFKEEGCLSFPGRVENTTRFQEIYLTNNLNSPHMIITGLMAVVCQHEIDHYNSIIFTDHKINDISVARKVKLRPNDLCLCGSKIKYKRCCGK